MRKGKTKFVKKALSNRCKFCGKPESDGYLLHWDGTEEAAHISCIKRSGIRVKLRKTSKVRDNATNKAEDAKLNQFYIGNSRQNATEKEFVEK